MSMSIYHSCQLPQSAALLQTNFLNSIFVNLFVLILVVGTRQQVLLLINRVSYIGRFCYASLRIHLVWLFALAMAIWFGFLSA